MISTGQTPRRPRFWSTERLALTLSTFAVALVALSSCGDTGTEVTTANKSGGPKVTINSSTNTGATVTVTNSAANTGAKPVTDAMPPGVRETPLKDINGKTFRLADYGGKVVVLNMWATWCGPCRIEIPHLIELSKEFGPKGVEVIGLSTEEPEQATQLVRDFAREFKINYRLGWGREIFIALLRGSNPVIPQAFVITRDGRIYKHFAGFDRVNGPAKLRQAVEEAAAMSASGSP